MNGSEWLDDVSKKISDDATEVASSETRLTVREFIGRFGYARRGSVIVSDISSELDERNLQTTPFFNAVSIDSVIFIEPKRKDPKETAGDSSAKQENGDSANAADPTIRIGALTAAGRKPVSVKRDDPLNVATTIMQFNDFSQLPVMQSEYEVKGVVSWKSIAARVLLGREHESVRQCMVPAEIIDSDKSLFEAVGIIQRHDYVLVQDNNKIMGIVTASDIAQQFAQLSTPFLLVGEIEGQVRRLIHHGEFTSDQLSASQNPKSANPKPIEGPEDLTFGDYVQLLGKEENWSRLGLSCIDRKKFVKRLDEVREIRNDVMHFSLDDLPQETIKKLEDFAGFFRNLVRIGLYDG